MLGVLTKCFFCMLHQEGWRLAVNFRIASVARSCVNPRRHAKTSEDERRRRRRAKASEDERRRAITREDARRREKTSGDERRRSASLGVARRRSALGVARRSASLGARRRSALGASWRSTGVFQAKTREDERPLEADQRHPKTHRFNPSTCLIGPPPPPLPPQ